MRLHLVVRILLLGLIVEKVLFGVSGDLLVKEENLTKKKSLIGKKSFQLYFLTLPETNAFV